MGWMFDNVGRLPAERYEPFTPGDSTALRDTLRPRDVLLVEGNNQSANSAFRFEFMSGRASRAGMSSHPLGGGSRPT
jgi:hypothetical protein